MRLKWYISVFVAILAFYGARDNNKAIIPNQEIEVQFTNANVTVDNVEDAIAIVELQLQTVGASNIQVRQERGKLKITYYSHIDVATIKKTLSNENHLALEDITNNDKEGHRNTPPSDENSNRYNLDVYEIQKANDLDTGFEGYVLERITENDGFFIPNFYVPFNNSSINERNKVEKVAYINYRNIAIAINHTLHKIPEVRAGPHTLRV